MRREVGVPGRPLADMVGTVISDLRPLQLKSTSGRRKAKNAAACRHFSGLSHALDARAPLDTASGPARAMVQHGACQGRCRAAGILPTRRVAATL